MGQRLAAFDAQSLIDNLVSDQFVEKLCSGELDMEFNGVRLAALADDTLVPGYLLKQLVQMGFDSGVAYGRGAWNDVGGNDGGS